MGENKHIKELDAFAKKYVKEIKAEKTASDFTSNLMSKINVLEVKTVYKSVPLISKKVWFALVAIFLALLIIPFGATNSGVLNLPKLDFSFLSKFQISGLLEMISISNTVFYTFLFFGIMIFVQIVFLKNHFDKKLS